MIKVCTQFLTHANAYTFHGWQDFETIFHFTNQSLSNSNLVAPINVKFSKYAHVFITSCFKRETNRILKSKSKLLKNYYKARFCGLNISWENLKYYKNLNFTKILLTWLDNTARKDHVTISFLWTISYGII